MKKLLSIALIVVLLFGFSFGEVTSLLELESFNVDCFTMLPWRGLQFNEGTSLYGEFSVYGDFDIGIFQYTSWSNVKDLNNDEIDLILSYKINLENLCFNILYTEYNLPAQNDWGHTREIGFSILMMDKFIVENFRDIGKYGESFFQVGMQHKLKGFVGSIKFGNNQGQWTDKDIDYLLGEVKKGFGKFNFHVGLLYNGEVGESHHLRPYLLANLSL